MNKIVITAAIVAASTLGLAGCVSMPASTGGMGGGDYTSRQARTAQSVQLGVIDSIRPVKIAAEKTRHGTSLATGAGAITGAALGSQVGKGSGRKVAIVLGALAGGAAGAAISNSNNTLSGIEIIVSTDRGSLAVTQADEGIQFRVGDRVRLLKGNDGTLRVAPM